MDEGQVKMHGSLREVLTAYKGKDPFAHLSKETLERLGHSPGPDDQERRVS
jgi:ABC-2 type transport system ATP-binding protein